MHTRDVLARIGGSESVALLPTLLSLAVVLELSPIGAGLIMAGWSGASLGAELGAMRLTEQIDALEVLGFSPMRELVGPRVLACMVTLPILTVFMDYLALTGSFAAEHLTSGMTWLQFSEAYLARLQFLDVVLATLKPLVFGYLVGVAGCYFGMRGRRNGRRRPSRDARRCHGDIECAAGERRLGAAHPTCRLTVIKHRAAANE